MSARLQAGAGGDPPGRLPVFVYPASLSFFTDDKASHRQLLTIYNPYQFPFTFKVLSTAPQRYAVSDASGIIKAGHCEDLVIRHRRPADPPADDKFRVDIRDKTTSAVLGSRVVPAVLSPSNTSGQHAGLLPNGRSSDQFQAVRSQPPSNLQHDRAFASTALEGGQLRRSTAATAGGGGGGGSLSDSPAHHPQSTTSTTTTAWFLVMVVLGVVAGLVLCLPPSGDDGGAVSSPSDEGDWTDQVLGWLADLLRIDSHKRQIAAYVLGLVTMAILRP